MKYKTILVQIDHTDRSKERINIAIALAKLHNAHLVGLATVGDSFRPFVGGYEHFGSYAIEAMDAMEKLAADAAQQFENQASAAGSTSFESKVATGDPVYAVCTHSRYCDLIVLGQSEQGHLSVSTPASLPQAVVLSAGRPVLIVPYVGRFELIGRRILLLWNATRESSRAASDALPFLAQAHEVQIALFNAKPNMKGHGEDPGSEIAQYLVRHGVKATVKREICHGDVGETALSRAVDFDSDLIVMGGYGHTRIREFILGGVSKLMLDSMTIPVLMSH